MERVVSFVYRLLLSFQNVLFRAALFTNLKLNKVVYVNFPLIHGYLYLRNHGKLILGSDLRLNSSLKSSPIGGDGKIKIVVRRDGELIVGSRVGISGASIYCVNKITIGDDVFIGGDVRIYDNDFHSKDPKIRTSGNDNDIQSKPVRLDDFVFIGAGSIILKGCHIGKNSIVGAGSVVSKNIPPNEIWAGNPAKFLRNLKSHS